VAVAGGGEGGSAVDWCVGGDVGVREGTGVVKVTTIDVGCGVPVAIGIGVHVTTMGVSTSCLTIPTVQAASNKHKNKPETTLRIQYPLVLH
jgi:hypothetical protein